MVVATPFDIPVIVGLTAGRTQDGRAHIDGAACVVAGSQMTAIAEERLTRRKHHGGCHAALHACLEDLGLALEDVDLFVASTAGEPVPECEAPVHLRPDGLWTLQDLGVADDRIVWCPSHHLSHALHAYHAFSFPQALVCVCDFAGNSGETNSVFLVGENGWERILRDSGEAGIAAAYAGATDLLGLDGATQAGHTMALAAFGGPLDIPLVQKEAEGWVAVAPPGMLSAYLVAKGCDDLAKALRRGHFWSRAAIAATAQVALEESVANIIASAVERTDCRTVIIAGGVGTNCRLIGELRRRFPALIIRAPFAPGDTGQALGNALWGLRKLGVQVPAQFRSPFLGPVPGVSDLARVGDHLANYRVITDPISAKRKAIDLLKQGAIVALCEGRSEFGPRALGHRSLVCRADQISLARKLNKIIKRRDWYRPFGCVIRGSLESNFMEAAICASDRKAELSGALHVDGTTRIQSIDDGMSGCLLPAILAELPVVINTSLNTSGMPMAETGYDAADIFDSCCVDGLYAYGRLFFR